MFWNISVHTGNADKAFLSATHFGFVCTLFDRAQYFDTKIWQKISKCVTYLNGVALMVIFGRFFHDLGDFTHDFEGVERREVNIFSASHPRIFGTVLPLS
jgi:hypothetical protein